MRQRIGSAIAMLVAATFLGAEPVGGSQPLIRSTATAANSRARNATDEAIRDLFGQVWNASDKKVTGLGAAALRRAKRSGAEIADVDYAYGLVLLHRGAWRAAINVLERVVEAKPMFVPGYVALAECRLRSGKIQSSFGPLADAVARNPTDRLTIDAVASLVTFLTKKPPVRIKSGRLTALQDSLFPRLDAAGQAEYRAAVERIDRYLADLPKLREKLLEPIAPLRRRQAEIAEQARRVDSKRVNRARAYEDLRQRRNVLIVSRNETAASYDRQIARALANDDQALAESLTRRKNTDLQGYAFDLGRINAEGMEIERELKAFSARLAEFNESFTLLDVQIEQEESAVDRKLALPPLPFDPEAERDRFLASLSGSPGVGPFTGFATPKATQAKRQSRSPRPRAATKDEASVETPPTVSKDERKATGLLTNGKSLLASGKSAKAADRFHRILTEYPDTTAAQTARKLLEDLE